jgi:hypothetical protein
MTPEPYILKPGVVGPPKPELYDALVTAADVYKGWKQSLVVTSLRDGQHMPGSLHPRGYAADLRSSVLGLYKVCVVKQLQLRLGAEYQVVIEETHIHLEYDPHHDGGKGLA